MSSSQANFSQIEESKWARFCGVRFAWFLLIFVNFAFGICGIVLCTLRLHHYQKENDENFYKLSIIFASCNLILSVLLLIAVIKNNQKYACLCAFLNFLSLFCAILHVESGTTANAPFIAVFITVGVLFMFWFCLFALYQVLYESKNATHPPTVL